MTVSREKIINELRRITLPDGGDIVSLDMVKALVVHDRKVTFVLEVPSELGKRMDPVREAAVSLLEKMPGIDKADVVMTAHADNRSSQKARGDPPNLRIGRHPTGGNTPANIEGVKKIIAVASGKGGVGKSTVATNLSVSIAKLGKRVGLLDADIHGPSIPTMLGKNTKPRTPDGNVIEPLNAHGVKFMSIGLLLPPEEAVIWRGPMLMGALQQMLQQVTWGKLDVLVVDLPPGTGDVQLTLCQKFNLDGALIVCTPQDVAMADARRAIAMFKKLNAPILGLVENMAYYICEGCGRRTYIFGQGGVRRESRRLGIPFLGEIPIDPKITEAGDCGKPIAIENNAISNVFALIGEIIV